MTRLHEWKKSCQIDTYYIIDVVKAEHLSAGGRPIPSSLVTISNVIERSFFWGSSFVRAAAVVPEPEKEVVVDTVFNFK